MRRHRFSVFCLLFVALAALGLPTSAFAGGGPKGQGSSQNDRDDNHNHGNDLSNAVRRVERENRGQVLSAEQVEYEGREVNRIKVVDDRGRVRVIMDDPHKPDSNDSQPQKED